MKKYLPIALIGLAIILLLVYVSYQTTNRYSAESTKPMFDAQISEFTEIAQLFGQRGPGNFCKVNNGYDVNGDFFNVKQNAYFIGGGPLGDDTETTYEKLLQNVSLTDSQFHYFKDFLDKTPFVECLEVRMTSSGFTGVEFQLPYPNANVSQKGFLYVVRGNPNDVKYSDVQKLDTEKWYTFTGETY